MVVTRSGRLAAPLTASVVGEQQLVTGAAAADRPSGPVLGVAASPAYAEHHTRFPSGASVVLYTDGLVERRGEHIDGGFSRLAAAATALRHFPPAQLIDGILARLHDRGGIADDIAVVAASPLTV